jgi:hypothetical protein
MLAPALITAPVVVAPDWYRNFQVGVSNCVEYYEQRSKSPVVPGFEVDAGTANPLHDCASKWGVRTPVPWNYRWVHTNLPNMGRPSRLFFGDCWKSWTIKKASMRQISGKTVATGSTVVRSTRHSTPTESITVP